MLITEFSIEFSGGGGPIFKRGCNFIRPFSISLHRLSPSSLSFQFVLIKPTARRHGILTDKSKTVSLSPSSLSLPPLPSINSISPELPFPVGSRERSFYEASTAAFVAQYNSSFAFLYLSESMVYEPMKAAAVTLYTELIHIYRHYVG